MHHRFHERTPRRQQKKFLRIQSTLRVICPVPYTSCLMALTRIQAAFHTIHNTLDPTWNSHLGLLLRIQLSMIQPYFLFSVTGYQAWTMDHAELMAITLLSMF